MGREAEVLDHTHPMYFLLNNGDDSVAGSPNKSTYARLLAHVTKHGSPYCQLEVEDAIRYGGMLLYRDHDRIAAAPDPHTYINNWWSPERGISHSSGFFRTEPELAWVARRDNFKDHPQGGEIHELVIQTVRDIYGINIDQETRNVRPPAGTELYTLIKDDPSKLDWMDIDVPDFIADEFVGSLQTDEYAPLVIPHLT
jgi:hypothetical protein